MKKILLFLVLISFFACKNKVEKAPNTAVLKGIIENQLGDFITISHKVGLEKITDTARVDSTGKFILKIDIKKPGYYTFFHGRETASLYLSPGDSINLKLNTDEFDETLSFDGKGALANNYIIETYLLNEKLGIDYREIYKLEKNNFISKIDSIYKILNKHLEEFIGKNEDFNDYFISMEKNKLLYKKASLKIKYPESYKYMTKNDSLDLGEDYNDYLNELNLNDSNLLELPEFINFLISYMKEEVNKLFEEDTILAKKDNGYMLAMIKVIQNTFTDHKIKEYLLYNLMYEQLRYYGINNIDEIMKVFKENCTKKEYLDKIEEEYKNWEVIAFGKKAPVFEYQDIEGNLVSLSDFIGKYVYIDIWATWCGPCIGELPYLEKLNKDFKNKNIVFMSVSVDKDKDAWKKMVIEKEMKGLQLFADKAWESSIAVDYLVHSIPSFILIDKEGNIINPKAKRPSAGIYEVIQKLEGL